MSTFEPKNSEASVRVEIPIISCLYSCELLPTKFTDASRWSSSELSGSRQRGRWGLLLTEDSLGLLVGAEPQTARDRSSLVFAANAAGIKRRRDVVRRATARHGNFCIALSDKDSAYALTLGLVIWMGTRIRRLCSEHRIYLPKYQGNDSWFVLIAATFVVGQDRRVIARHVDPDFRKRMDPTDILATLDQQGRPARSRGGEALMADRRTLRSLLAIGKPFGHGDTAQELKESFSRCVMPGLLALESARCTCPHP